MVTPECVSIQGLCLTACPQVLVTPQCVSFCVLKCVVLFVRTGCPSKGLELGLLLHYATPGQHGGQFLQMLRVLPRAGGSSQVPHVTFLQVIEFLSTSAKGQREQLSCGSKWARSWGPLQESGPLPLSVGLRHRSLRGRQMAHGKNSNS